MRTAIIDIGTNTINLLIAEIIPELGYNILLETKLPAKLGKGGINDQTILPEAFDRGKQALNTHLQTIADYGVEKVVSIATSAIRSAKNGDEFVRQVKQELNLDITVVDGHNEAQLIYDGVKQVVPIGDQRVLILDIGGGSNEFIIANRDGVLWKHSFDLGIARLLDLFNPSDPITIEEVKKVENYIRPQLQLLFEATRQYNIDTLIGSSGSFDTIAGMIAAIHHPHLDMSKLTSYFIPLAYFKELHQKYLKSTHLERAIMKRMDPHRIEMIVLASIFINFILRELHIQEMWQCAFALKEGTMYQIMHNQL